MNSIFSMAIAKVATKKRRITEVIAGHAVSKIIDLFFDYGVYTPVILLFGPIKGGIIMMLILALVGLLELRIYDRFGRDWLGFEAIKEFRNDETRTVAIKTRLLKWALRKGDVYAFFILSYYFGPFSTTVYLRKGHTGLTKRDWIIFLLSTIVSNWWWVMSLTIVIETVKFTMRRIS